MLEKGSALDLQGQIMRTADDAVGVDVKAYLNSKTKALKDSIGMSGLDRGLPDLDLPRNDDSAAIQIDLSNNEEFISNSDVGSKLNLNDGISYYSQPVPVSIPRSLGPLPAFLSDNLMNKLYFHHFLNHTARILVAHDCSHNPFREILPQSTYTRLGTRGS